MELNKQETKVRNLPDGSALSPNGQPCTRDHKKQTTRKSFPASTAIGFLVQSYIREPSRPEPIGRSILAGPTKILLNK